MTSMTSFEPLGSGTAPIVRLSHRKYAVAMCLDGAKADGASEIIPALFRLAKTPSELCTPDLAMDFEGRELRNLQAHASIGPTYHQISNI